MRAALVPLQELKELKTNAKAHDLGIIHTSIDRFGFLERVIINDVTGCLLAGHGRRKTLLQKFQQNAFPPEGIEMTEGDWLVPCDYVSIEAGEEEDAAALVLNRSVELGGWIEPQVLENLQRIAKGTKQGLEGTGYDNDDLDDLLQRAKENTELTSLKFSFVEKSSSDSTVECPACRTRFSLVKKR